MEEPPFDALCCRLVDVGYLTRFLSLSPWQTHTKELHTDMLAVLSG